MMFKAIIEILTLIGESKEEAAKRSRGKRVKQLDKMIGEACDKYGIDNFEIVATNSINQPAKTVITITANEL